MRIHDQMRWGQLAELWTLDCRQYRSHQACPDPNRGGGRVVVGCTELQDAERSMLGPAQEQWLYPSLTQSTRRWKLLAQSTQMSSSGIATPLGRSSFTDGWDGYPLARERLLNTLAQAQLKDVLVLGGDVHMNVVANLRVRPNDDKSPVVASEMVTTSISSRGLSEAMLAQIRDNNPDIVHARADERGYTSLEVQPSGVLAQLRTTPHPVMPGSRLQTQAQWALSSGVAGWAKA
jgi:alkaline phosphatase D